MEKDKMTQECHVLRHRKGPLAIVAHMRARFVWPGTVRSALWPSRGKLPFWPSSAYVLYGSLLRSYDLIAWPHPPTHANTSNSMPVPHTSR